MKSRKNRKSIHVDRRFKHRFPVGVYLTVICSFLFGMLYSPNSILNSKYCLAYLDESINWYKPPNRYSPGNRVVQWDGKHSSSLIHKYGQPKKPILTSYPQNNQVWVYDNPGRFFHINPNNGKISKAYFCQ